MYVCVGRLVGASLVHVEVDKRPLEMMPRPSSRRSAPILAKPSAADLREVRDLAAADKRKAAAHVDVIRTTRLVRDEPPSTSTRGHARCGTSPPPIKERPRPSST